MSLNVPEGLSEAVQKLGPVQTVHAPKRMYVVGVYVLAGLLALYVVIVLVLGSILVLNPPQEARNLRAGWILLGLALILLAGGAVTLFLYWGWIKQRLLICPGGLALWWPGGEKIASWGEIDRVYQKITRIYRNGVLTRTRYVYTLQKRAGEIIKLTDFFAGIEEIGARLSQEVLRRKLPAVQKQYQLGEEVEFGPLRVSRNGISQDANRLDWSEVEAVEVQDGKIKVRRAGTWLSWCRVPAARIPNLVVFLALVDAVVGIKRPPSGRASG